MKATGMVRNIDSLGRIVLPIELRRALGIEEKDPVEIFVDKEYIALKKYTPSCTFCDEAEDLIEYNGKRICRHCLAELERRMYE